jgi:hypothetical protein
MLSAPRPIFRLAPKSDRESWGFFNPRASVPQLLAGVEGVHVLRESACLSS